MRQKLGQEWEKQKENRDEQNRSQKKLGKIVEVTDGVCEVVDLEYLHSGSANRAVDPDVCQKSLHLNTFKRKPLGSLSWLGRPTTLHGKTLQLDQQVLKIVTSRSAVTTRLTVRVYDSISPREIES